MVTTSSPTTTTMVMQQCAKKYPRCKCVTSSFVRNLCAPGQTSIDNVNAASGPRRSRRQTKQSASYCEDDDADDCQNSVDLAIHCGKKRRRVAQDGAVDQNVDGNQAPFPTDQSATKPPSPTKILKVLRKGRAVRQSSASG
jgi:hypothetical protein